MAATQEWAWSQAARFGIVLECPRNRCWAAADGLGDGPVAVSPFVTIKYSATLNRREIFLLSYCLKKILHEFRVKKFVYLGTSDRVNKTDA